MSSMVGVGLLLLKACVVMQSVRTVIIVDCRARFDLTCPHHHESLQPICPRAFP